MGTNFVDPMTVEIYGGSGASIPVNNAAVANGTQLSFTAPAVLNSSLNLQPCVPIGGTSVTGTRYVPTSFGIRLRNARTGCSVDLPNVLIYNPADTVCRAPLTFAGVAAPTATLCSAYGPVVFTAAGGFGQYNLSVAGLPEGVTFTTSGTNGQTVTISGIPELAASGPARIAALQRFHQCYGRFDPGDERLDELLAGRQRSKRPLHGIGRNDDSFGRCSGIGDHEHHPIVPRARRRDLYGRSGGSGTSRRSHVQRQRCWRRDPDEERCRCGRIVDGPGDRGRHGVRGPATRHGRPDPQRYVGPRGHHKTGSGRPRGRPDLYPAAFAVH
ncbi:MAG: hypothetical protein IPF66_11295 [Holophagales bacterium]|nr:hypothetical protein [Holophagales bacterium]